MTERLTVPSHERAIKRGAAMAVRGEIPPRLRVRCSGDLVLVVGKGEPAPLVGTFLSAWLYLDGTRFVECERDAGGNLVEYREVDTLRVACKRHARGHTIDPGRLRRQIGVSQVKVSTVEALS